MRTIDTIHSSVPRARAPSRSEAPPWVFAVRDEGHGLYALYTSDAEVSDLVPTLERFGLAEATVEVSPRWRLTARRTVNELATRVGPIDLVHSLQEVASTVLADPHEAVPVAGGRFAFTLSADGHGVLYSRELPLLVDFVRSYIESRIAEYAVEAEFGEAPTLAENIAETLVEPLEDGEWHEARLRAWRGRWMLTLATGAHPETRRPWQWVVGQAR
jgi:hypothetical protein